MKKERHTHDNYEAPITRLLVNQGTSDLQCQIKCVNKCKEIKTDL